MSCDYASRSADLLWSIFSQLGLSRLSSAACKPKLEAIDAQSLPKAPGLVFSFFLAKAAWLFLAALDTCFFLADIAGLRVRQEMA